MEAIENFVGTINGIVWGWPMIIFLVGTHIFLTIRLKFIQAHVFKGIKLTFSKDTEASGDVTQWGALATALSATFGTGNIVGVATAVVRGGPGAVLWLWFTGLFGIATKYGEALLAIKYRVKTSNGLMLGGPMYAIERGMNMKWLGILFAVFTAIACFGIGNLVQINSITVNLINTFANPNNLDVEDPSFLTMKLVIGIVLMILTFICIVGGIKTIAKVAEWLIPIMAIFFFICCLFILLYNGSYIGRALGEIFKGAFSFHAITGGMTGYAVMQAARFGIARGLFSNEAGLGSAPIAAAAAVTRNPVRQGLVSMSQVFWDTICLCAVTGTMYVTCYLRWPEQFFVDGALIGGGTYAAQAFSNIPGGFGSYLLTLCVLLFAWTTTLGWGYYGERSCEYIGGKKAVMPFKVVYSLAVFIGAITSLNLVWDIADTLNGMMAIPNLISLIALSGLLVKLTKEYLWDKNLDAIDPDPIMEIKN